ncbi:MAG: hypothetical protein MJZ48_04290 [Paludibacteraceae bacterium]|nr:hypothetical protein [Paludibacteraceae bacterium]
MHYTRALILVSLFYGTSIVAQNVYDVYPERVKPQQTKVQKSQKEAERSKTASDHKILTGFTGGMKFHLGYAFAQSPDELFRNGSLTDVNLSSDGVTMGLGGELRLHFINHVHLGVEGGMSAMPLKHGSSIRTGWGGVLCDFYGTLGKVQLCIGGVIGGGATNRLYVPETSVEVQSDDATIYNASYTKTPYFMLDPYIGLEAALTKRMGLLIKVDYMLPFGKGDTGITKNTVRWSNFLSPSGPRLYVGVMFGRHDKR